MSKRKQASVKIMKSTLTLLIALLLAPPAALHAVDATKPSAKPNFIVILSDDQS